MQLSKQKSQKLSPLFVYILHCPVVLYAGNAGSDQTLQNRMLIWPLLIAHVIRLVFFFFFVFFFDVSTCDFSKQNVFFNALKTKNSPTLYVIRVHFRF